MQTNDGELIIVSGDSRSGKTALVYEETRRHRRVLVFDTEAQWAERPEFTAIRTRAELVKAIQTRGAAKLAFIPSGHSLKEDFEFWAECAMFWGRYRGACTVIAEELADVSTPAKAPPYWGILCRRGLKRGITIYAISQRWAEADKTALGNASRFVVFVQASEDDAQYMARKTRIPIEQINALNALEWLAYSKKDRKVTKGAHKFKKKPN